MKFITNIAQRHLLKPCMIICLMYILSDCARKISQFSLNSTAQKRLDQREVGVFMATYAAICLSMMKL